MAPPRKNVAAFFGIVLFLSSWHLFGGGNDNVTSRAAMVTAIVEHGTLRIDEFAEHAGDKALIDGHYYSEKAPLPALLVVPFWWAARISGLAGAPENGTLDPLLIRLGGFLVGSVPFALIVTLMWYHFRNRHWPHGLSAALVAIASCFGSFLFIQSGALFGHLIGAAFLLMAVMAWERERILWCGVFTGCAVLCEYTNALFPLFWVLLLLLRRDFRRFSLIAAGGLPAALLLAAYNMAIAGTPFMVGYTHQVGYDYMHTSAGMGCPDPYHLWHITFSDYRGLFFYAPVLVVGIIALFGGSGTERRWNDPVMIPALVTIVAMSGFGGWWGGWTYGPRYLTAVAVMLLYRCLPSLAMFRWSRAAFFPAALFGLLCAFAAKDTVGFSLPTEFMHPLIEVILPSIGKSHAEGQWPVVFGIPATWSSMTFYMMFILGSYGLHRSERRAATDG